jgi:hypothetical protein
LGEIFILVGVANRRYDSPVSVVGQNGFSVLKIGIATRTPGYGVEGADDLSEITLPRPVLTPLELAGEQQADTCEHQGCILPANDFSHCVLP